MGWIAKQSFCLKPEADAETLTPLWGRHSLLNIKSKAY